MNGTRLKKKGGAVYIGGLADVNGNTFLKNRATTGSGLFLAAVNSSVRSQIVNNLLVDNMVTGSSPQDSVVMIGGTNEIPKSPLAVNLHYNTISASAPITGAAIFVHERSATVHNNIITHYQTGLVSILAETKSVTPTPQSLL